MFVFIHSPLAGKGSSLLRTFIHSTVVSTLSLDFFFFFSNGLEASGGQIQASNFLVPECQVSNMALRLFSFSPTMNRKFTVLMGTRDGELEKEDNGRWCLCLVFAILGAGDGMVLPFLVWIALSCCCAILHHPFYGLNQRFTRFIILRSSEDGISCCQPARFLPSNTDPRTTCAIWPWTFCVFYWRDLCGADICEHVGL